MHSENIKESMSAASAHHRAGRLVEAERAYNEILAIYPLFADALHLLGVVFNQTGRLQQGEELIRRAISVSPAMPDYHSNLGLGLLNQGKVDAAIDALNQSIRLRPNDPDVEFQLGTALAKRGRHEDAVARFRQALRLRPKHSESHLALGKALLNQGKIDEAIVCFREATTIRPDYLEAISCLGAAFAQHGDREEAADCFRRAVELKPDSSDAHNNLGVSLTDQGNHDDAYAAFEKSVELNANNAKALNNLGKSLMRRKQVDAGVRCLRRASGLDSGNVEFLSSLGASLCEQGKVEEGIDCCRLAVEKGARSASAWNDLGFALACLGLSADAVGCFRQSISLQPERWDAHFNMGLESLRLGDLERGWPEYEWRWKNPVVPKSLRNLPGPRWQGEDLRGRTLLVHGEQGMGDLIQMCRYAPMIAERGIRVLLVCHPPLKKLLSRLDGVSKVFVKGETADPFHFHVPVMSLPAAFRTTLDTIPNRIPYLTPDPELVANWGGKLGAPDGRLRVGLVWAGNPGYANDRKRSTNLSAFSPLAGVPQVAFYSLQKGNAAKQASDPPPGMKVVDLSSELNDFSDTAAVMTHLDLIITVDTSVAHLSGALGRPAWTLIPFSPDWRWLLHRTDSPWYPTMKLFRQDCPDEWDGPLQRVARDLAELARQGPGRATIPPA